MKYIYLLFALTFICFTASAQLKEGTFIIGGSGSFQFVNSKQTPDLAYKVSSLAGSPSIGVFLAKKFATGLRFTYSGQKQETPRYSYTNRDYDYSPYARYYLLSDKKPYNIIADISFDFWVSTNHSTNGVGEKFRQTGGGYTASAGPVIFFTPQVALEWMMGYKGGKASSKTYVIFTSIGFQWHFRK